jgi:hypothetical protein
VKNWDDKVFDGTLDDGMDHGDEFAEGFQRFDPDLPNDEEE